MHRCAAAMPHCVLLCQLPTLWRPVSCKLAHTQLTASSPVACVANVMHSCNVSLPMQPATVGAAAAARQLLAQAAPSAASPAAPRVHLSFQLAGYSSNASLAAAIQSSLMPTAVKVLQKMFQVRLERCLSTPHAAIVFTCCAYLSRQCSMKAVVPLLHSLQPQGVQQWSHVVCSHAAKVLDCGAL